MQDEDEEDLCAALPSDFPMADLLETCHLLAEADVCVPGYIPPPVGLYHPNGFFYEQDFEGIQTWLLPDRNVASRLAQLAQGAAVRGDQQLRIAAGLLAFSQCLHIEAEPSIAFHELAHKQGNEEAWTELGWFRAANNAVSQDLLDLALGRQDVLSRRYEAHVVNPRLDLATPIKRWNRNYIIALKMLELEQLSLLPIDRVLRLFNWMRDDFMFGGPAALMASVYFAPNSPPRRRVFKDKNSLDREAAIAGVRNAAWDLTHLSEFVRRVNEEGRDGKTRYLFASFDKHLRKIAKLLFDFGTDRSRDEALPEALSQWWGSSDAQRIAVEMRGHLDHIRSPQWKAKVAPRPDFIGELIREGEDRLRDVEPRGNA
ncbi:hypothetical protein V9L20_15905 [Variovorax sp. CCNWLW225]|uniref:hypothetical protein n=1 Tax=Variovorax sp. CCNWLW225 TaxID=3127462 RepID=UPI003076E95A